MEIHRKNNDLIMPFWKHIFITRGEKKSFLASYCYFCVLNLEVIISWIWGMQNYSCMIFLLLPVLCVVS